MTTRTSVLLGAGASVDAGLPLTFQLAEMVVARANHPERRPYSDNGTVRTLNFVYGAMVGYQAEDGSDPLESVNIERLISAVRLLKDAKNHEVAPFVASWRGGAFGFGGRGTRSQLGRKALEAIGEAGGRMGAFSDQKLADAIAEIARESTRMGDPRTFERVEESLLEDLSDILGQLAEVDYLSPISEMALSQDGGIDVLTLNYDLAIETMADRNAVPVHRAIESWTPGKPLLFEEIDGRINLIKIHGSLDWVQSQPGTEISAPVIAVTSTDPRVDGRNRYRRPWIVVGEREKLATDGPTLALLRAAEDVLQRTQHLVVVGYSFGDAHINGLIRNWLLGAPERTIGIVDTNWARGSIGAFRKALVGQYGSSQSPRRTSRVVPIVGTAKQRLSEALTARPIEIPDPYGLATIEILDEKRVAIRARLHGPDLHKVTVQARATVAEDPTRPQRELATFLNANDIQGEENGYYERLNPTRLERWNTGEELIFYCRKPLAGSVSLVVHGLTLDREFHDQWTFEVTDRTS